MKTDPDTHDASARSTVSDRNDHAPRRWSIVSIVFERYPVMMGIQMY